MDKTIKMQMWDTAGMNKFKSIVKSFYRGGNIIVFVYAVDNRESFEEAVRIYEDLVKEKTVNPDAKAVVIANKTDLDRVVSSEEGIEFAQRVNGISGAFGYGYYEVSCKFDPMVIAHSICLDFYRIWKDKSVSTILDLYSAGPEEGEKKEKASQEYLSNLNHEEKYDFLLKFCLIGP